MPEYDPKGDFNKDGKWDLGDTFNNPMGSWRRAGERGGAVDAQSALADMFDPSARLRLNYENINPGLLAQAQNRTRTDPYSTQMADRTRAAQLALMEQMRAQQGSSLASLQGQQAMGRSGQQALGVAAGGGAGGRAAMLGAQQAGAGLSTDVAQARLAEMMRSQAGIGGAAGTLRGNDLNSANNAARGSLQAQMLVDQNARTAIGQGMTLQDAARNAALERYKLFLRIQKERGAERNAMGELGLGIAKTALTSGMG